MKKFLFSILFIVSLFAFQESFSQSPVNPVSLSDTTNTNAVTKSHIIALPGETNNFEVLTFEVLGTKVSGTVTGTAILYGSVSGAKYTAIGADTLTFTNATSPYHHWTVDKTRYKYYKVDVTTSGTQVSYWHCYLLGRKQPR